MKFLCQVGLHRSGPNIFERDEHAKALIAHCRCRHCPKMMGLWMKLDHQNYWRDYDSQLLDRRAARIIMARQLGRDIGELIVELVKWHKRRSA